MATSTTFPAIQRREVLVLPEAAQYLRISERKCWELVDQDLIPYFRVGNGIRFLNRFMSSNIFNRPEEWQEKLFEFLKLHQHDERQLLVNGEVIHNREVFFQQLEKAIGWLKSKNPEVASRSVEKKMKRFGFEVGWGDSVGKILETMRILNDLLNEPTAENFEQFISRVPMPLISSNMF